MWVKQYETKRIGFFWYNKFVGYKCDKCGFTIKTNIRAIKNSACPQCRSEREVRNEGFSR